MKGTIDPNGRFVPLVAQAYIHIQESYIIHPLRHIYFSDVMPAMTLKNAALLALIGTILMTALLVWDFVLNVLNVLRSIIPVAMLFPSFTYAFGCFCVAAFFYMFHKAQS